LAIEASLDKMVFCFSGWNVGWGILAVSPFYGAVVLVGEGDSLYKLFSGEEFANENSMGINIDGFENLTTHIAQGIIFHYWDVFRASIDGKGVVDLVKLTA